MASRDAKASKCTRLQDATATLAVWSTPNAMGDASPLSAAIRKWRPGTMAAKGLPVVSPSTRFRP